MPSERAAGVLINMPWRLRSGPFSGIFPGRAFAGDHEIGGIGIAFVLANRVRFFQGLGLMLYSCFRDAQVFFARRPMALCPRRNGDKTEIGADIALARGAAKRGGSFQR